MTNEELEKKICDIIAPYVSAYGDDEAIANALILEGIGYVWDITEKAEKAIASLIKQNKELQHRAEVAEQEAMILARWLANKTRKDYPWKAWFNAAQKQAEKELAEEKKE